jgi:alanyl-tRNA synthetase
LLGTKDLTNPSLRVIADHIRACSFLITDGVVPSNEGRGYVLRRIARRAMRHGHKFGVSPTFFNELVPTLVKVMGAAFPELVQAQARVREVLLREGEQFERTLETGREILCTIPTASRQISPPTSRASAGSRPTWRDTSAPCSGSANSRRPRASSAWT